jgi:hypothetical protein
MSTAPHCVIQNAFISSGSPVLFDVRKFDFGYRTLVAGLCALLPFDKHQAYFTSLLPDFDLIRYSVYWSSLIVASLAVFGDQLLCGCNIRRASDGSRCMTKMEIEKEQNGTVLTLPDPTVHVQMVMAVSSCNCAFVMSESPGTQIASMWHHIIYILHYFSGLSGSAICF